MKEVFKEMLSDECSIYWGTKISIFRWFLYHYGDKYKDIRSKKYYWERVT